MTREEQTAKILKNGFRYKGKKVVWFKILSGHDVLWKAGNTFYIDSCTARKATEIMWSTFLEQKRLYPQENLEIIFAGTYDKEAMGGL